MYGSRRDLKAINEYNNIDECALQLLCPEYKDYQWTKSSIDSGAKIIALHGKQLLLTFFRTGDTHFFAHGSTPM